MNNSTRKTFYEPNTPTFSIEDSLPPLPLPSLKSTLKLYIDSIQPFLQHEENVYTQKIAEEFEKGIGVRLQDVLNEKAKSDKNWVAIIIKLTQSINSKLLFKSSKIGG